MSDKTWKTSLATCKDIGHDWTIRQLTSLRFDEIRMMSDYLRAIICITDNTS